MPRLDLREVEDVAEQREHVVCGGVERREGPGPIGLAFPLARGCVGPMIAFIGRANLVADVGEKLGFRPASASAWASLATRASFFASSSRVRSATRSRRRVLSSCRNTAEA